MQTQSTNDEHQELIQLKYKSYQLEHENRELRQKLKLPDSEMTQHHQQDSHSPGKIFEKNFGEQIPVSEDHYKIPIAIRSKLVTGSDDKSLMRNIHFSAYFSGAR